MHTRSARGEGIPGAVADAVTGGPGVAVAPMEGTLPADWRLAEQPLQADTAVLVGTSGSTGPPKGVLLSRGAIAASVAATHSRLGGPGHWVCPLPLHYVAGVMTVARAAIGGTRLSVVPSDLSELPHHPGRNYTSVVAAQLHRALASASTTSALAGFDAVLVGGSAIPASLLADGRAAGITLIPTYGMAETCGGCVYDGVPLDGVHVQLGDQGRISLTAPMAFSGYRLDPAATAASLDGRTVRTHDRGRWTDGRLQVLGRVDDVVITGGVNVDLGLAQRASDTEFGPGRLALLAVPDDRFGVRIVALTALPLTLEQCRDRLAAQLAPAALPRALRVVAGLPRTSTGKIDRQSLHRAWAEGS